MAVEAAGKGTHVTRLLQHFRDRLEADAIRWGVTPRLAWLLFALPLVGVPLLAVVFLNRELFDVLLAEDGIVESVQVVLLVGVVAFAAGLAARLWRQQRRSAALIYAVLAVGALFVAFEEISWGQRILGLQTPEGLGEVNTQGELNIHNIGIIEDAFEMGQLVGSFYGLAIPLIVAAGLLPSLGRRLDAALVPPLFLSGALLISFTYRVLKYPFFPTGTYVTNRFAEYSELVLFGAVLAVVWLGYRRWAPRAAAAEHVMTVSSRHT